MDNAVVTTVVGESFFNILDYVYIIFMGASTIFGFANGLARTIFSMIAWIGSGFLSIPLTPYVYKIIDEHIASETVARLIASSTAYALTLGVALIIAYLASDAVKQSMFSGMDRALGLLFGFLRGLCIPAGVVAILIGLGIPQNKFMIVEQSKISVFLFAYLEDMIPQLMKIGTNDTKDDADKQAMFQHYQEMAKQKMRRKAEEAQQALYYHIKAPNNSQQHSSTVPNSNAARIQRDTMRSNSQSFQNNAKNIRRK